MIACMTDHQARLVLFPEDQGEAEAFVVACSCGTASLPFPTKDEAVRWATEHGATLGADVEVLDEEPGTGWGCVFCGSTIEDGDAPLRISVRWTDDGVDGEQWYAAHRRCLIRLMSPGEQFSPQFTP
jgi:hypothetical protein